MNLFEIASILFTLAALGSYINFKWLKFPPAIGLMLVAMVISLIGLSLKNVGVIDYTVQQFLANINFQEMVFHGMLSFLLFAGALQVNIDDLKNNQWPIAITATLSTVLSTLMIGFAFYALAQWLRLSQITLIYALLFGAILSPTDPIAVLSIIKKMSASKMIETTIVGESLFNDGVAIVLFVTLLKVIHAEEAASFTGVVSQIVYQAGGGFAFGGLIGWLAYQLLKDIGAYQVALLVTLAVATGGYSIAEALGVSAPIAMVVAGVIIGNHGRKHAMSVQTRKHIDLFWEVIDELLNIILFLLIGMEMMTMPINGTLMVAGTACIVIALLARALSLAAPLTLVRPFYKAPRGTLILLTWGGLRGALSIAMVLSLSNPNIKSIFLPCIYCVVFFSIAIQGLTFGKLLKQFR